MQLDERIYNFPLIIASLSKLTIVCNIRCELIISFSRNLKFSKKQNFVKENREYYSFLDYYIFRYGIFKII
jgi:hypothetical protein